MLPLGDVQYNSGTASEFAGSYDPSWGRLKAITHPAVGNHEYGSPGAAPYFQYFGAAAGRTGQGLLLLRPGLVAPDRAQLQLRADRRLRRRLASGSLAAGGSRCAPGALHARVLAPPALLLGPERRRRVDDARSGAISTHAGADVVLNGHDHDYERFAPQDAQGGRDDARGIREFVVGTGGKNHMTFKSDRAEQRSARHDAASASSSSRSATARTPGDSSPIRPAASATAAAAAATDPVTTARRRLLRQGSDGRAPPPADDRREREEAGASRDEPDDAVGDPEWRRARARAVGVERRDVRRPGAADVRDDLECRRAVRAARLDVRVLGELVPADHADRIGRGGLRRRSARGAASRRLHARRRSSRRPGARRSRARRGRSRGRRGRGPPPRARGACAPNVV